MNRLELIAGIARGLNKNGFRWNEFATLCAIYHISTVLKLPATRDRISKLTGMKSIMPTLKLMKWWVNKNGDAYEVSPDGQAVLEKLLQINKIEII
jgi:hypothetical protein